MRLPEHVYHLAEAANWSLIEVHGLLPAEHLIRSACPNEAAALVRRHRPQHTVLPSGVHVRDQKPMPPAALASCLTGLTPAGWYELVNAHVFFWFEPRRLDRQRAACFGRPQVVAIVRTAELLEYVGERAFLTPFNIGYALRKPARRSAASLVPYAQWLSSKWSSETRLTGGRPRSQAHRPVELLVRGPIPQFRRLVQRIVRLPPGASFRQSI